MKILRRIFIGLLGLALLLAAFGGIWYRILLNHGPNVATYIYAMGVYSRCLSVNNKLEIESIMSGRVTSRQIDPSESFWGNNYELRNGEYMVQYLVKDVEPIDIVYDSSNTIVTLFESYE